MLDISWNEFINPLIVYVKYIRQSEMNIFRMMSSILVVYTNYTVPRRTRRTATKLKLN